MGPQIDWEGLAARAWLARENSYAPYSQFPVGAALLAASGEVFGGCNVENASFGLTICAERVAAATAVAAGAREFLGLAIVADTRDPVLPCGACRQFLAEFSSQLQIWCCGRDGSGRLMALGDLLPSPFLRF